MRNTGHPVRARSAIITPSPSLPIARTRNSGGGRPDRVKFQDASGNLVLQTQASVSFKGRPRPVLRNFRLVVTPPEAGVQGEVNAISTAVGQLADGLAAVLVGR